ncbi:hypothetical protein H4R99_000736 [Coemansia sp. RSA 1722]|nr:hypothetical protein LPJ57_000086 [Coemansia sp. RSA 486]KAJ2237815.1 hypothetical protein IWW45_000556 [Coemansia sp. RSA 485]KAJ2603243.1 hypothetical protein GGF39_000195 [Coemansia sp. RSA 1721]KAJ2605872.1 hypothetical protein H4R99_000736 [Coemansia sp. RSA 1722]KAJ2639967.1 hypothetical protein GGF40_000496 [Coemansia sp. RSA 1286]
MAKASSERAAKVVVNTSSVSELKTACDTGLKEFLKARGYEEMHTHTDVKLILGYIGVVFCAIDFAYSWKYPFEQTKWFSYISVGIYAVTSVLALVYSYAVQRDTFFVGYNKAKGHVVSAGSRTEPDKKTYKLTLTTRPIRGLQDPPVFNSKPMELRQSFETWFHEDGEFAVDRFGNDVASVIEALLSKKDE